MGYIILVSRFLKNSWFDVTRKFLTSICQRVHFRWSCNSLNHFIPSVSFCSPWKHHKSWTFLFSGGHRNGPAVWNGSNVVKPEVWNLLQYRLLTKSTDTRNFNFRHFYSFVLEILHLPWNFLWHTKDRSFSFLHNLTN